MLMYAQCDGVVPGKIFSAPGRIIAVAYNGLFLPVPLGLINTLTCSVAGEVITLNFNTQVGDRIYALCVPY